MVREPEGRQRLQKAAMGQAKVGEAPVVIIAFALMGGWRSDMDAILQEGVRQISSPWTDIKIAHMEGAVSRVASSATAYGNRSATFALVIQARWEDAAESEAQIRWARELRDRLAPYATGGAYANFIAADEANRVSQAHGAENYRRLQILKAKYDGGNLFHANANVPPLK